MLKYTVYYDGYCPMCTSIVSKWQKWDVFKKLSFQSFREIDFSNEQELTFEELEKHMHIRDMHSGKLYKGAKAITKISGVIPLMWVLWVPLKLSTILGIGELAYDYVARRRKIIPSNLCAEDSCKLPNLNSK